MLHLQITYKDGEVRNITNDLNYDQFRALVEHIEKGNGKMAEFKEIKIIRVKTKGKISAKAERNIVEGLAKGKLVNIYYEKK